MDPSTSPCALTTVVIDNDRAAKTANLNFISSKPLLKGGAENTVW
jgi:hypothetical protein